MPVTGRSFCFSVERDQEGVMRRSARTGVGWDGGVRIVRGMSDMVGLDLVP